MQEALGVEEKRRQEAVSAVETERRNVTQLHQGLASERAASYNEVVQLKNKYVYFIFKVQSYFAMLSD